MSAFDPKRTSAMQLRRLVRTAASGCMAIVVPGCANSTAPSDPGRVELRAALKGADIDVTLLNRSPAVVDVPTATRFAGRGGGNLAAIVIDDLGRLVPPCAFIDTLGPDDVESLRNGSGKALWRGTSSRLAKWHCLAPGKYTVAFVYRYGPESLVISNPLAISVTSVDATSPSLP